MIVTPVLAQTMNDENGLARCDNVLVCDFEPHVAVCPVYECVNDAWFGHSFSIPLLPYLGESR